MKKISLIFSLLFISFLFTLNCGDSDRNLPAGAPVSIVGVDTSGNGQKDAFGYMLRSKGNTRIVYQELDKNGDRMSDEFIWVGSTSRRPKEAKLQEAVKVYEESDENNDGTIDTIRWFLPNEYISMILKDTDNDGYFETTEYFNYQKKPVRTEIDTNEDGLADIFIWSSRAEIDTDFDKTPDLIVYGNSKLELEEKAVNRKDTKPLNKATSYFINPKLIPFEERSIIGSGLFVE